MVRRISYAIDKAVGRQWRPQLPWWGVLPVGRNSPLVTYASVLTVKKINNKFESLGSQSRRHERGCRLLAGTGVFEIWSPCWSCRSCSLNSPSTGFIQILTYGESESIITKVGVPGGGPYILSYGLANDGYLNSWDAIVEPARGPSFPAITLESLTNEFPFDYTVRRLPLTLPAGTTSFQLTFIGRNVSPESFQHPAIPASRRFFNQAMPNSVCLVPLSLALLPPLTPLFSALCMNFKVTAVPLLRGLRS